MKWEVIKEDYLAVAQFVFSELKEPTECLADEIVVRLKKGNKVMACGNGGSAADAQHFAGEMVNRFLKERRPYAGLALSTDASVLTCIGNDYSFDEIFEKQISALGKPGDILMAFTTSGNSKNIVRAVQKAREMDILTVGIIGGSGGELLPLIDLSFCISCTTSTPRIQEGHQLFMHLLCELIEIKMEQ